MYAEVECFYTGTTAESNMWFWLKLCFIAEYCNKYTNLVNKTCHFFNSTSYSKQFNCHLFVWVGIDLPEMQEYKSDLQMHKHESHYMCNKEICQIKIRKSQIMG